MEPIVVLIQITPSHATPGYHVQAYLKGSFLCGTNSEQDSKEKAHKIREIKDKVLTMLKASKDDVTFHVQKGKETPVVSKYHGVD